MSEDLRIKHEPGPGIATETAQALSADKKLSLGQRTRLVGVGIPRMLIQEGFVIFLGAIWPITALGALIYRRGAYRAGVEMIGGLAETAEEIKSGFKGFETQNLKKIRAAMERRRIRWNEQDNFRAHAKKVWRERIEARKKARGAKKAQSKAA